MTVPSELERRQRQTMHMLRDYVDHLPVTAAAARAVTSLAGDPARLSDEVERLAHLDPTLAIRMLYLANHTFLGSDGMQVNLGAVMTRIGAKRVAEGMAALASTPELDPSKVEIRLLWEHSTQVAAVARLLVLRMPQLRVRPDEVYLAGLVHDLGRFVMVLAAPARCESIAGREWRSGDELLRAEVEVCGFTHTTLGWLACRAWNFPDQLADVNRGHHEWLLLKETDVQKNTLPLVRVVGFADEVAFAWEGARDDPERLGGLLQERSARLHQLHGRSPAPLTTAEVVSALQAASAAAKNLFA